MAKKVSTFNCRNCHRPIGAIIKGARGVTRLTISRGTEVIVVLFGTGLVFCPHCNQENNWYGSQQWLNEYIKSREVANVS